MYLISSIMTSLTCFTLVNQALSAQTAFLGAGPPAAPECNVEDGGVGFKEAIENVNAGTCTSVKFKGSKAWAGTSTPITALGITEFSSSRAGYATVFKSCNCDTALISTATWGTTLSLGQQSSSTVDFLLEDQLVDVESGLLRVPLSSFPTINLGNYSALGKGVTVKLKNAKVEVVKSDGTVYASAETPARIACNGTNEVHTEQGVKYDFTGDVSSSLGGVFIKTGLGTLRFGGMNNTYPETVILTEGTLEVAGALLAEVPSSPPVYRFATLEIGAAKLSFAGWGSSDAAKKAVYMPSDVNVTDLNSAIHAEACDVVLAGKFKGPGKLNLEGLGGGTFRTFGGYNVAEGGTRIAVGATLQVLDAGWFADGDVELMGTLAFAANATVPALIVTGPAAALDARGNNLTIANRIMGTGQVSLVDTSATGKGTVFIPKGAVIDNHGGIAIKMPTRLEGTVTSLVTVAETGVLKGTGKCGFLGVWAEGTVSPGLSSGTIQVGGAVNFARGAMLNIDLDANGASSLVAGGLVDIAPGAELGFKVLPGFSISSASEFTILESDIGILGDFDLHNPYILMAPALVRSARDLKVRFDLAEFSLAGLKGNPQAVGEAFDEIIASGSRALNGVIDSLVSFTTAEISSALNQMHPALYKGLAISQENNAVKVRDSLSYRMQNELDREYCYSFVKNQADPSKTEPCSREKKKMSVWIDGFGDVLRQKSEYSSQSNQYEYQNKTGGLVLGLDRMFAKYFYAGALGGYTSSDIHWEQDQGSGNIDTGYGGLYFSALSKMFYANASVIGGWSHFNGKRNVSYPGMNATAKNNHGGAQLLSHLDTGLNLGAKGFTVRPFDSFDYISQSEGGFTEKGAGSLNLDVKNNNSIMLRNELGLQFAGCMCLGNSNWTLSPKISWVREVRVKGARYTANFINTSESFNVTGYFPDRSLVSPGVMLSGMVWDDLLTLDLYYNGEFGRGYTDHNYGGQLRFGF